MRKTLPCCCASAITPTASNTTTTRINGIAAFFIAHLVSSVMYHADRDKGKCDLHGGRRQNQPEIELNDASEPSHTRTPRQHLLTPSPDYEGRGALKGDVMR